VKNQRLPGPDHQHLQPVCPGSDRWNKWTFLPSARYDYTRLKPKHRRIPQHRQSDGNGTVSDENKTWHRVSPKFGLTYALTDNTPGSANTPRGSARLRQSPVRTL
jgi:hemoglobin/transferrin/lactoferrin receptor protein